MRQLVSMKGSLMAPTLTGVLPQTEALRTSLPILPNPLMPIINDVIFRLYLTHLVHQSQIMRHRKQKVQLKSRSPNLSEENDEPQLPENTRLQYLSALDSLDQKFEPPAVLCRQREVAQIRNFITEGISNRGSSSPLYISGVAGIGKTFSVQHVLSKLGQFEGEVVVLFINCCKLVSPQSFYSEFVFKLTGKQIERNSEALRLMQDMMVQGRLSRESIYNCKEIGKVKLLILDQIDFLIKSKQDVLYNILQWEKLGRGKLVILSIANTIDFYQQLKPKVQSRFGDRRIIYRTYNSKDMEKIIVQRIDRHTHLFEQRSLQFISKKITNFSSDIRKALQIIRRSVHLALQRSAKSIDANLLEEAYNQVYLKPLVLSMQSLSRVSQSLLIVLYKKLSKATTSQIPDQELFLDLNNIRFKNQEKPLLYQAFLKTLFDLREYRLLKISQKSGGKRCEVRLMVSFGVAEDWVSNALSISNE